MAKEKAPATITVAFRVPAKTKQKVDRIYKTFEDRKKLNEKFNLLYEMLLQK